MEGRTEGRNAEYDNPPLFFEKAGDKNLIWPKFELILTHHASHGYVIVRKQSDQNWKHFGNT